MNKIKEVREKKGISQRTLAWNAGTTDTTLRSIENNENYQTSLLIAERIAEALGIDVEDLFEIEKTYFATAKG
jgi:DNA-binding XRE family transcriptional regulator